MAIKKKKVKDVASKEIVDIDPGYLYNTGKNFRSYEFLGSHFNEDRTGVIFRVWAPRAKNVEVAGDFNDWGSHGMSLNENTGIWETEILGVSEGMNYKYRVTHHDGTVVMKADPFAFFSEFRPGTASRVMEIKDFPWTDSNYLRKRKMRNTYINPMNIYEVHLGSWVRHPDGRYYNYTELKEKLIPYIKDMGYTHLELMPLMEHPNDESWGYQITGYYSLTSRFGTPEMFQDFINECHNQDISVIMDWVPSHFVTDEQGLRYFDGTATYEYMDYNRAYNQGWGTMHFDLNKSEVHSFLISNALFFMDKYHIDGLRVDAVSSMIYLDYGGKSYIPNKLGGNTDLEAIEFIKKLNNVIAEEYPGVLMIAEESTAFEGITDKTEDGGLGFHYKWNMGWMNDILRFIEMNPEHRVFNQRLLNFSFIYSFNEKYILPLSHDEVVHGKKSILDKNPLDLYKKFAGFRTLMAYMFMHPGKKLNFMTNDIAQMFEWRYYSELEWVGLANDKHLGAQNLVRKLSHLYKDSPALYELEMTKEGIDLLDLENPEVVFKFLRRGKKKRDFLACIFNFDTVERHGVKVGVPYEGQYEEIINTESVDFGGNWTKKQPVFVTKKGETDGMPYYIEVISPSLSGLIIKPKKLKGER